MQEETEENGFFLFKANASLAFQRAQKDEAKAGARGDAQGLMRSEITN